MCHVSSPLSPFRVDPLSKVQQYNCCTNRPFNSGKSLPRSHASRGNAAPGRSVFSGRKLLQLKSFGDAGTRSVQGVRDDAKRRHESKPLTTPVPPNATA